MRDKEKDKERIIQMINIMEKKLEESIRKTEEKERKINKEQRKRKLNFI